MRAVIAVAACALVLPGCGGGAAAGAKRSGRLVDVKGRLPPYLGLIASADGGRSWRSVSKLGESDFHKIVARDGRLYALDAVLGSLLISSDGGRSFVERFTPPGLSIDFEVDPGDADDLLAATDARLVRSTDGGERWARVGKVPGEPYKFKALRPERLDLALSDGTIVATQDGGRHWKETFDP